MIAADAAAVALGHTSSKIITDFSCSTAAVSVTLAVLRIELIRTVIQWCGGDKRLRPRRVARLKIETGCAHESWKTH